MHITLEDAIIGLFIVFIGLFVIVDTGRLHEPLSETQFVRAGW